MMDLKYIAQNTKMFAPIGLENMGEVKLMNRVDTKFWFNAQHLSQLFDMIKDEYFILTVNNKSVQPYSNIYYDTNINSMYLAHHNGKLNRYKIRRRNYDLSGIGFLEVKFKNNKGRTRKQRMQSDFNSHGFSEAERNFIQKSTPFSTDGITPFLLNKFSRITLVNKNFKERCTIDFNLHYEYRNRKMSLDKLIIVEVKSDGIPSGSPLVQSLYKLHIRPAGFSKYCIGRSVTDTSVKKNRFKQKLRMIEKTINT